MVRRHPASSSYLGITCPTQSHPGYPHQLDRTVHPDCLVPSAGVWTLGHVRHPHHPPRPCGLQGGPADDGIPQAVSGYQSGDDGADAVDGFSDGSE